MFHKNQKSQTITIISMLLLLSVFATACGGAASTEPITDITWQWVSLSETEPASQSVNPQPENFTLLLGADGSLSIKADCNMVSGGYTLEGSSLTIQLGPSTLAYCGDESLDTLYLDLLGKVASYKVEGGKLLLELKDGTGTVTFQQG